MARKAPGDGASILLQVAEYPDAVREVVKKVGCTFEIDTNCITRSDKKSEDLLLLMMDNGYYVDGDWDKFQTVADTIRGRERSGLYDSELREALLVACGIESET